LARKHAISLANEDFGVFLLNEEYCNDKYGVVREAEMPLLLM
jgi:CRISPR-associated endonuclease/helicase Cas3